MKKLGYLAVVFLTMCLTISACGGVATEEKRPTLADQTEIESTESETAVTTETESETETEISDDVRYLNNLAEALNARWSVKPDGNKSTDSMSVTEFKTFLHKGIDAEKSVLEPADNFDFQDKELAKLAAEYEQALLSQEKELDNITDLYNVDADYTYSINKRYVIIDRLGKEYDLPIDKNSDNWAAIEADISSAVKNVAIYEWIQTLEINWEVDEENTNEFTTFYKATIENTSGYDIQSLSVQVDLFDEDDVIIDQPVDYVENMRNGQKYHISFMTDHDYDHLETTLTAYDY